MRTVLTGRRWMVVPVVAGVVLLLLLAAVAAGLRVPSVTYVGLPRLGALDYRGLSADAFHPLRSGYVDQLLGTHLANSATQPPAGTEGGRSTAEPPAARPKADEPAPTRPVVLEHEFTNDDMASPVVISSLPFTARTDTTQATRESGEPRTCSQSGGTAWYRYTAKRDGILFTDTFGSDHATAVGIFAVGRAGLTEVGCASGVAGNAQVGFASRAGATYLFQVAGLVRGGRLVFHLAALGRTELLASNNPARRPVDDMRRAAISGDGRYVAFDATLSEACNASSGRCAVQILLTDRRTGRTTLVSRSPEGAPGNLSSIQATLSYDGRFVGFTSRASNLVQGDTNDFTDYFVHDRVTGRTIRASVGSHGEQGSGAMLDDIGVSGDLSDDGRFVAFTTAAGGLVPEDRSPGNSDLFVRDLRRGITTREGVNNDGTRGIGVQFDPRISNDGRYVGFLSNARNYAKATYSGDNCGNRVNQTLCLNVFLRDRRLETTRLVSVNSRGEADSLVDRMDMSRDGSVLAWTSTASVMDSRDTNGVSDVFVVDLRRGTTRIASVSSSGERQNDPGGPGTETDKYDLSAVGRYVAVSADGNRVVFDSRATNLVPGDTNGFTDIFLRDIAAGLTVRVSTSSSGQEANGDSARPAMSADGRVVAFESAADNLVTADTNHRVDVFVHDLRGV